MGRRKLIDDKPELVVRSTKEKIPVAQIRLENEKLLERIERLKTSAYCRMCDTIKDKSKFYICTDPLILGGVTPICKECAKKLALQIGDDGVEHEPTKESCCVALRYMDKPFLNTVWNASMQESENLLAGNQKSNVWYSYVKNIGMGQYNGLTYKDSDMFHEHPVTDVAPFPTERKDEDKTDRSMMDVYTSFTKNKNDVIRLLDYDPFEGEPEEDQPFLYSQLLGMLDASEDANEDMMRVSSAIQIVRAFLQSAKIDDAIAKLMGNIQSVAENSATIKTLQDSKQKLTSMITNLAAESCLSLKNSKSKTKGEDTFTGRLRKLKELNLRDADLNGFDIATCKGMQQVADISMSAIIKGLHFTEDEMADIVATQRQKLSRMDLENKSYREAVRILLKENLDLRDTLDDQGLIRDDLVNIDDFVGTYLVQEKEVRSDE